MTPSASGRPKNTFSGGVGGRGVVSVSGCRVGVGVLFRGRGVVSGSGCGVGVGVSGSGGRGVGVGMANPGPLDPSASLDRFSP